MASLANTLPKGAAPHPTTAPAAAPSDLATQALTLAQQYTNPIIAAYKATRDSDLADARNQAGAITAASQGGASLLGPLGDLAKNDYAGAVNTEQKSAAGFSKGLAAIVRGQAGRDAAALEQTGSPLHAPDASGSLADLLYGLGGKLPGDALATQGLGAVEAARALPASLIASGITQSEGALGAGQSQANRVDAQIAATEGGVPGLASRLALQLQQMGLSQQAANRPVVTTAPDGSLVAIDPNTGKIVQTIQRAPAKPPAVVNLADGSTVELDAKTGQVIRQLKGPTQTYSTQTLGDGSVVVLDQGGNVVRTLSGPPAKPPTITTLGDGRTVELDSTTGQITRVLSQKPATKPTVYSTSQGLYSYDPATQAVTRVKGQPPLSKSTKPGATLSPSQAKGLAGQVKDWHTGYTGTAGGKPQYDQTQVKTYADAMQLALSQAPDSPAGYRKATEIVNAEYFGVATADQNVLALKIARGDKASGVGLTDSIKAYMTHASAGDTTIPPAVAAKAIAKAYGVQADAVTVLMQQVAYVTSEQAASAGG